MTHREVIKRFGEEYLQQFYNAIVERWGSLDDHPYDEDDKGLPIPPDSEN